MKFQFSRKSVPIIILGVLLAAFGLLLPNLGFYWDDWVFVYFFDSRELAELWDFAAYYRPISAWFYYLTVPLLGDAPINWQLFTLALRWLTAWSMWAVLSQLWPKHWRETAWMAIIFAVYPTFLQQAIAVTYSHQYLSYLLFFVSLWLMIRSLKDEKRYWIYTLLSAATQILHLSLVEYYVVLEMIRPVIIWLLFFKIEPEWKRRSVRTAKSWAPYLAVLICYVVWRLFIVQYSEVDPNALAITEVISQQGLNGVLGYLQIFVRDLLHVLVTGWFSVLQPEFIDYQSRSSLLAWFAGGTVSIGLWMLMRSGPDQPDEKINPNWYKQAGLLGLLAAVFGLVPGWITGIDALVGRYGDRVTLAAMFGASIVVVALVFGLVSSKRARVVILSLLVGLSVAYQFRITNAYRWDWERQQRAYWQMFWRAPGLKEGASLVTDGALTTYANRYSSGMAVNLLYGQAEQDNGVFLFEYFYDRIYSHLEELKAGETQIFSMRGQTFAFNLDSSIFIYGPEEAGQCVWFLNPGDVHYLKLPGEVREIVPYLDLDQILAAPASDDYPSSSIFGPEINRGWCYYFQKADLARQYADWDTVVELEIIIAEQGYTTEYGYELLPFLEARLAQQQWMQAAVLIKDIDRLEKDRIRGVMCAMWENYLPEDMLVEDFVSAETVLEKLYACSTWTE